MLVHFAYVIVLLKDLEYSARASAQLQMVIDIPNSQRLVTDFLLQ
jgi:hypothetical protein